MVQMPDELDAGMERLRVVHMFMIWKAATAFVHAAEIMTPDASTAFAVTHTDVTGGLQRIRRKPLSFGEVEWFGRESAEEAWLQLFPARMMTLERRGPALNAFTARFDGSAPRVRGTGSTPPR